MKARSSAAALALVWALGMTGTAHTATIELISRADPVPDTFGDSRAPALSADGRWIAFLSESPNLVPGQVDDNDFSDVFLHDQVSGTTALVSHAAGSPSRTGRTQDSYFTLEAGISADGRYVVYTSPAVDLVPGGSDTNQASDVFLYDRDTGVTTLVSHAFERPQVTANGLSHRARISADGNRVVFVSSASNLIAGQIDPTRTEDVFVWERATGTTALVSRQAGTSTTAAESSSVYAEISADGGVIVFTSYASDLIPGFVGVTRDGNVFVFERSTGVVTLASRTRSSPVGGAGVSPYHVPQVSADGRVVAFVSHSKILVPGQADANPAPDAFVFDRFTGEMSLASHASSSPVTGAGVSSHFAGLTLSADGRFLVFTSPAANLVSGQMDPNGAPDVFAYDRASGAVELISHVAGSPATAPHQPSAGPAGLSADGRFVTYSSTAIDLVSGQIDTPSSYDVFLYDRRDKTAVLVSRTSASATTAAGGSFLPSLSVDGHAIVFRGTATGLGDKPQADPNSFSDLFLFRRTTGEIASVSHSDPSVPAVTPFGPSALGDLSADGQRVLFLSLATGLVPGQIDVPHPVREVIGQPGGTWDVFLRDRAAGTTLLLSRSPSSPVTSAGGRDPALSADGRFAAFVSSELLERPPVNGPYTLDRLLLYDRTADTLTLVNPAPGSAEKPQGVPSAPTFSADGRFLAFACTGCSLVVGQQAGSTDEARRAQIFLYDRGTGIHTLVSSASRSPATEGDGSSLDPEISADGRFVAFRSLAADLVDGQTDLPDTWDVFLWDRLAATTAIASHAASAPRDARGGDHPVLSRDGRFLAFRSRATDLVPGQTDENGTEDVFLWDRISGVSTLVSHTASSPTAAGNGPSAAGELETTISVSADGRFVAYDSRATDLVAGGNDTNGAKDVFVWDRRSGTISLISHAPGLPGTADDRGSGWPHLSADGRRIAYVSGVKDLIPGLPADPSPRLIVQDRTTGTRALVAPLGLSTFFAADLQPALVFRLSGDGRITAFQSDAQRLVHGDQNLDWDVFVSDDGGILPLPPCTLFDTRRPADGPALRSGTRKTLAIRDACGVPATATAVVVNVTVPQPRRRGSLRILPGDALLRFQRGQTRTGTFTVPLAADGTLALQPTVAGNGTVHAALEIVGYQ